MADITIKQVTEGTVKGQGVFDTLMKAVKAHLQEEFNNDRITGKDYSEVYLSAVQVTLQQAIAFVLGEQTADKQADLLVAQTAVQNAEALLKAAQTNLTEEQAAVAVKDRAVKDAQIAKLGAEKELLTEKKYTEQAQRVDIVNGLPVAGVIGKQKNLYQAQTDGFSRDAEQKILKIMVDTWSVRQTTDGATTFANGLSDSDIGAVMNKARQGIGL